jgi:predicted ribosomally synthesized peptide with nif11-like leader
MSQEAVTQFFANVYDDKNLQGALAYALVKISPESIVAIAKEKGFNFSVNDLKALAEGELDLQELEAVAGGASGFGSFNAASLLSQNFWSKFSAGKLGGLGGLAGSHVKTSGPSFARIQCADKEPHLEDGMVAEAAEIPSAIELYNSLAQQ